MATVLVTGIGGTGGIATARALINRTDHTVVGVDADPTAPGLYMLDQTRVVPPAESTDWRSEIVAVIEEFDVDAIIPLVDEELSLLPDLAAVVDDLAFVAPREPVISIGLDKYQTAKTLASHGLTMPTTRLVADIDRPTSVEYPVVVKPRRGRGSRGVAVLESPTDFREYLASTDCSHRELVVQEYIEGTEYTTSVVATRDDHVLATVPKEAIEKDGNTVHGVTREAPTVVRSCERIASALQPRGPLNVQQIVDHETGDVHTIELNPRFSSTACLTVAAGVNELDLLVRDALGESVSAPNRFETDLHLLRHTDQTFVSEPELRENLTESAPVEREATMPFE